MKKRIGKQTWKFVVLGICVGIFCGNWGKTENILAADVENPEIFLSQRANWIDEKQSEAEIITEVSWENSRDQQEEITDGSLEAELSAEGSDDLLGEENDEEMLEITNYISEYFKLSEEKFSRENAVVEKLSIINAKGQEDFIEKVVIKIKKSMIKEERIQIVLPVTLREDYGQSEDDAFFKSYPVNGNPSLGEERGQAGVQAVIKKDGEIYASSGEVSIPCLEKTYPKEDFMVSVMLQGERLKAGEAAVYQVCLTNTGDQSLTDILLTNVFSCPKVTWEWQPASNLEVNGEKARLLLLEPGQSVSLYIVANLLPEQKGRLTHTVTAKTERAIRETEVSTEVQELRADFMVEKTADCSVAVPGDEISYQICIRNTGELPLHSIVTTEHFLKEGICAHFVEKDGVKLNKNKNKAFIPLLEAGDTITLKAIVELPKEGIKGELFNEVIVLTKETGEREVTAQTGVQIELPVVTPLKEIREEVAGTEQIADIPKTGDTMEPGKKAVLLFISFMVLAGLLAIGKGKRKH